MNNNIAEIASLMTWFCRFARFSLVREIKINENQGVVIFMGGEKKLFRCVDGITLMRGVCAAIAAQHQLPLPGTEQ